MGRDKVGPTVVFGAVFDIFLLVILEAARGPNQRPRFLYFILYNNPELRTAVKVAQNVEPPPTEPKPQSIIRSPRWRIRLSSSLV